MSLFLFGFIFEGEGKYFSLLNVSQSSGRRGKPSLEPCKPADRKESFFTMHTLRHTKKSQTLLCVEFDEATKHLYHFEKRPRLKIRLNQHISLKEKKTISSLVLVKFSHCFSHCLHLTFCCLLKCFLAQIRQFPKHLAPLQLQITVLHGSSYG